MIDGPYLVLAVLGALVTGLMAGVFCAFSVLVMRGLAALPPAQGVAAMNAINSSATTPAFMVPFLGAAALCAVIVVVTFVLWPDDGAVHLLLGSALYLCGAFGVTVMANVPRNEALAKLEPGTPEAVTYWPAYLRQWTRWNHVRAVASAASALVYVLALV
ncbi:anthrone oxygenase family protein [Streptomyces sp. NPDC005476]|uniref:anthrone oxygenase family protein n=1 Tax=Streptomyces sp. NPDC005476 TaxID=3156882 RepID=UPI003455D167